MANSGFSLFVQHFACRDMYNEWTVELKAMADRIISMRQQLFDALRAKGESFNKIWRFFHALVIYF